MMLDPFTFAAAIAAAVSSLLATPLPVDPPTPVPTAVIAVAEVAEIISEAPFVPAPTVQPTHPFADPTYHGACADGPCPAPAEDDYALSCTQSPTCSPMHALVPVPINEHNDAYYGVDAGTGEIFYLTLEQGYVSTGQCVHMSPCYNGLNGPTLPESES